MDKLKILKIIDDLPDDIAKECYSMELIGMKAQLQWVSFLADKYKEYRISGYNDLDFRYFKINNWHVIMEKEN